jgi:hypothetical protein
VNFHLTLIRSRAELKVCLENLRRSLNYPLTDPIELMDASADASVPPMLVATLVTLIGCSPIHNVESLITACVAKVALY